MKLHEYYDDIQHLGIPTADLDATIAFWARLGCEKVAEFPSDDHGGRVAFLRNNHLSIETWTDAAATHRQGALDHVALNTSDADAAFAAAKAEGFELAADTPTVQALPYWEHGIRFFKVVGPNHETVEFCQVV